MTRADHAHPLAEEWLMDYAAGNLPPSYAAVAETYVSLLDNPRSALAPYEALGGETLEAASATPLTVSAADLIARAANEDSNEPSQGEAYPDYMPAGLQDFLSRSDIKVKWTYLGPGLRKALLWKGPDNDRLWLLKAVPGTSIPHHTHQGSELTLILKGGFTSQGTHFGVGDVEEADDDIAHTLTIDSDSECICLAATKGPLVFGSPIVKVMQLFLGI